MGDLILAACSLWKCPQIITLWDRVGESIHHLAAGEGGRRHKFLTSLTGRWCCCRCFGGHCCCYYLTITAKPWPTQKTSPRSLVIDSPSREHKDWMFAFSSITKTRLNKGITGRSVYSVFQWYHIPPTNHMSSPLLRAKCNPVPISQNFDNRPSRRKRSCYQFSLTKIYTFVHILFCTLKVGEGIKSQKCTNLKKISKVLFRVLSGSLTVQ